MQKGAAVHKKYLVELTKDERERLLKLIRAGEAPAKMLNRARILLKVDQGEHAGGEGPAPADREIARMLETSSATVGRVRAGDSFVRAWTPRWNARCPIGSTSDPSTVGPRRA